MRERKRVQNGMEWWEVRSGWMSLYFSLFYFISFLFFFFLIVGFRESKRKRKFKASVCVCMRSAGRRGRAAN